MSIKSNDANLIYIGCIICQTIDDLLDKIEDHKDCKAFIGDSSIKKLLILKDRWLENLSVSQNRS